METQLTTDGVEDNGYGGRGMGGGEQQQQQEENTGGGEQENRNRRQSANVSWSRDSKKFALVRRDSRKVKQLWVINALAMPRPRWKPTATPCRATWTSRNRRWRSSM